MAQKRRKIIIMGAAGRDFHTFNTLYRDNQDVDIVAFTATQIPDIEGRRYPASLAGELYPKGIPIYDESELGKLIKRHHADEVIFSYSDVPYQYVMEKAAFVTAAGARFSLEGGAPTMIQSTKPVVAVCAVRTGCGKSQTTRRAADVLRAMRKRVVVIRHPMPYGDLAKQDCQRFGSVRDLVKHKCTIEEREEYEPHIVNGTTVYAGVDYEMIIRQAEKEADVILWDGGNNDMSFYKPDFLITVVDPHRPGDELSYYPGQNNLLMADAVLINKMDTAEPNNIAQVRQNIAAYNPKAIVIDAASPFVADKPSVIRGKKVLVVEDGPTLTHGGMRYGAGVVAAKKYGAAELVDPRPYTVRSITDTFKKYPNIGPLLPAMGYGDQQVKDLEATIARTKCDAVIVATPINLTRILKIKQPHTRVTYSLQEIGTPTVETVLHDFFARKRAAAKRKAGASKNAKKRTRK